MADHVGCSVAGGRSSTLSHEQGKSHAFPAYCFCITIFPAMGSLLSINYAHLRALLAPENLDLQSPQKHTIVVSVNNRGAHSVPPLEPDNFDLSVCIRIYFLPLYRLLVITLEKKVVLKCGRMSNILGDL